MHKVLQVMAGVSVLFFLFATPVSAGSIHQDVPADLDPNARFLIYLHGTWPETSPVSEPHPRHGLFEYEDILEALADEDFVVISELRRNRTDPRSYARTRVVAQVAALVAGGVPAQQITVAGFSKGGFMSLLVSAMANEPGLNLVNMAGCGERQFRRIYETVLSDEAAHMKGRMLSLYDKRDPVAGTCAEAKAQASGLVFEEEELSIGAGHGSFYSPHSQWVDRVSAWAKSAPAS